MIDGFQNAISSCGLLDLRRGGDRFTWEKGRGSEDWVRERLDRALVTYSWQNIFQDAYVETLVATNSDHSPLFLCLNTTLVVYHKKRFCFENSWSFEEECRGVVEEGWQKQVSIPIDVRIQHVCARLKDWVDKQRDRFKHRLKLCRTQMARYSNKRDLVSLELYRTACDAYNDLLLQQETFWR
ncbi:hypothetical protein P3X46_003457 [Hevea brasiliensis]|uniref:Endonuclease/exonuclease/phosphatase domain-containing protein n=1 Tax=Hevea brasiliensis TaxID=3981 RepID=A0ABQ9N6A4_HEVBR|nr:hypothetical protein P3X46_003457 [Hevea brasiliensis]